ncbi:type I-MYXAN CRISPR-associated protein Cmx8 [Solidesulfovibrio alcoholivorans]|uniref:type I-MYXAN CRISPR-associated protein Cmx8 n=1 Tax=Solidesulfovibrio alcoholivorans TaxID=81406 RepID=UPI000497485A|nr:type I-MYXAN CRISPR-associated protein Cmx8 [Solidesulfovibrio alcoholivorans]
MVSKREGNTVRSKAKAAVPEVVELAYDLFELPSAQHKAGLAGMLLFIKSMKERELSPMPEILEQTETTVRLRLSREALQAMFDDLYAVDEIEAKSSSKWKGETPIREEKVTDKQGKTKTVFVYPLTVPRARWLSFWEADGEGVWLKLWRDMLWKTLRAIPKTRDEYLKTKTSGHYDLDNLWTEITTSTQQRRKVSCSLMLGVQDENAEQVPFGVRGNDKLLLHFWTLVCPISVPRLLKTKGGTIESTHTGFVLALPEPANIDDFVDQHRNYLRKLNPATVGMRPKDALIDLPAEGGLEYLFQLAQGRIGKSLDDSLVCGLEIHHLEKVGNSVKARSVESIRPRSGLLGQYEKLRGKVANPVYKQMRLANLLVARRWHADAQRFFNEYPYPVFISGPNTPRWIHFFGADVKRYFEDRRQDAAVKGGTMPPDDVFSLKVYQMIRNWVNQRVEEKCGLRYSQFKDNTNEQGHVIYPKNYREAKEKICADTFLAIRGRNGQDFVEYFVGNICAVPHFLPEADYVLVSRRLLDDWETVKTLAMLALSAASYVPGGRTEEAGAEVDSSAEDE